MNSDLFEQGKNGAAQAAWACLAYSLVPYLGILFVPLTLIFGLYGYAAVVRKPEIGDRRVAIFSLSMSFVVLGGQIFLWWLMFAVPELNRG